MINKKNRRGQVGFLDNGVNLIIGAIILVLLIFLAVYLYNLFSNDSAIKKSTSELTNIQLEFSKLEKDQSKTYLISSLINSKGYDWNLVSSEFGESCGGNFCLCFCTNSDCDEIVKCELSDKFVILKDSDPSGCGSDLVVESRTIKFGGKKAIELNLTVNDNKVYPINLEISNYDVSLGKLPIERKSIFLRYNSLVNNVEWSFDLEVWQTLNKLSTESGEIYDYSSECLNSYNTISENEKIFFKILQSEAISSDSELGEFLGNNGFKSSNGLYVIEVI